MRRYLEVLRIPGAILVLLSAFPARLAYGMISLGIYFKVQHATGSIAAAGLAVGLNGIAGATTAGLRSALIDRLGLRIPLRIFVPAYSLTIALFNYSHGTIFLITFAFLLGFTGPPINLAVRPLWKAIVPEELVRATYAIDTAAMSISAVIGPVLITSLALSKHPIWALNATALSMLLGGVWLGLLQVTKNWRPESKEKNAVHILRLPAIRVLVVEGIFIGLGYGAFDIAVPAYTTLEHVAYRTGWIFGTMAVFNIIGSLLAGLISKRSTPLGAFKINYVIWTVVVIPLAFTFPDWSLIINSALLGLVNGAQMVFYWEITEAVRPKGAAASALGWLWTFEGTAASLGSIIGGWISQTYSPKYCFAFMALCVFIGFLIINRGTKHLQAANRICAEEDDTLFHSKVPDVSN